MKCTFCANNAKHGLDSPWPHCGKGRCKGRARRAKYAAESKKMCARCGRVRNIDEYSPGRSSDGLASVCKFCTGEIPSGDPIIYTVVGGSWILGAEFDRANVMETLKLGNFPDDIIFERDGQRWAVERKAYQDKGNQEFAPQYLVET